MRTIFEHFSASFANHQRDRMFTFGALDEKRFSGWKKIDDDIALEPILWFGCDVCFDACRSESDYIKSNFRFA